MTGAECSAKFGNEGWAMSENTRMDRVCARIHRSHAPGEDRHRDCDHFYNDEVDPARIASNMRPDLNTYLPYTFLEGLSNPATRSEEETLKPTLSTKERARMSRPAEYFIFVPSGTKAAADTASAANRHHQVHVSLLFCVGDQMNRAGLRRFFEKRTDAVLITIPGVETSVKKEITTPWGVGIDNDQIDLLLASAGLDVDYTIDVLAAYSTGYHGMQATIREKLVVLDNVKQIVYYDCLYPAKQYKPQGQTAEVIAAFRKINSAAKIVIYEVTDGGTKRTNGALAIKDPKQVLINLKNHAAIPNIPYARYLNALIYTRLLDEGLKDRLFTRKDIPTNLDTLRAALRDRGEFASTLSAIPSGPPVAGTRVPVLLEKWGNDYSKVIDAIQSELTAADHLIFEHTLMGWAPEFESKIRGEAQHDQFLPEFAWEFLPPPP